MYPINMNHTAMKKTIFLLVLIVIVLSNYAQVKPRLVLPERKEYNPFFSDISADSKFAYVLHKRSNAVVIYDLSTKLLFRKLKLKRTVTHAVFSPDSRHILVNTYSQYVGATAIMFDLLTGKEMYYIKCDLNYFSGIEWFSRNGKYLILNSNIYEAQTGKIIKKFIDKSSNIYCEKFSYNNRFLLLSKGKVNLIYDLLSKKYVYQNENPICFSNKEESFYSIDSSKIVKFFLPILIQKKICDIYVNKGDVEKFILSPDDQKIIINSKLFDLKSGAELYNFKLIDSFNIKNGINYDIATHLEFSNSSKYVLATWGDLTPFSSCKSYNGNKATLFRIDSIVSIIKEFKLQTKGEVKNYHDDTTIHRHYNYYTSIWTIIDNWIQHKDENGILPPKFSYSGDSVVLTGLNNSVIQFYNIKKDSMMGSVNNEKTATSISDIFVNRVGDQIFTSYYDGSADVFLVNSPLDRQQLFPNDIGSILAPIWKGARYLFLSESDSLLYCYKDSSKLFSIPVNFYIDDINSIRLDSLGKILIINTIESPFLFDLYEKKEIKNFVLKLADVNNDLIATYSNGVIKLFDIHFSELIKIEIDTSFNLEFIDLKLNSKASWAMLNTESDGFILLNLKDSTCNKSFLSEVYGFSDVYFSPSGDKILINLGDSLILYDLISLKPVGKIFCSNVFSVAFTENEKYIILSDGVSLKYWDTKSKQVILNRFSVTYKGINHWMVYDENKHFDGCEHMIQEQYVYCNDEIVFLNQLKDSLWIPGLAGKIMRGEQLLINDKPAPKLSDLNICDLTPIVEELPKDAKGNLIFQITPRNGGLGETEVYINENLTYKFQPEQLVKSKNKEGKIVYQLNLSKDSITPFLSGNKGAVNPVLVKCKIKGASIYSRGAEVEMVTEKDPELPKLYAVFVGVNDYNNPQKESNDFLYKNLDYAAKDAGDLANMVEHSANILFDSSFIYRLTGKPNMEPTKDNLKKVLTEIGTKAKANDILYIFFAGHGDILKTKEEKNEIRFMLQGAEKRNKNTGGFGVEELTDWCAPKNIKAQKRVFVFDACHSGQFVNETMAYAQGGRGNEEEVRIRQLTSLKDKNGMMILAASSDNESAYEDPSLNQGVLTYHLLEAVKDSKDSTLQINKWFETTLDLVKEYANANNRKQTPETFGNGRFEIGNVNEQVRAAINIGAPKPRVGISTFIDPTGDAEKKYPNLEKLVNEHFKQTGARGNFISASSNEKAYYAKGSVLFDNNKLKVRYTIYYGDTPVAEPFSMPEMKDMSEQDVVVKIVSSIEQRINAYLKKVKK